MPAITSPSRAVPAATPSSWPASTWRPKRACNDSQFCNHRGRMKIRPFCFSASLVPPARPVLPASRIRLRYELTMTTTLLHVGKAITPKGEIPGAGILIRDGEIESIGSRADLSLPSGAQEIRAEDSIAIPGFIDVHIHGAGGRDVMEGNADALRTVTAKLAQF